MNSPGGSPRYSDAEMSPVALADVIIDEKLKSLID